MKKVALVTCYFKYNYGSMLQAYATQKILNLMGVENETINIKLLQKEISKLKRKYYLSQIFNLNFIKTKLGMVKFNTVDIFFNKQLKNNIFTRNKKFKEFEREFLLSKEYENFKQLSEEVEKNYTDVLVGSDQLWLPVNIVADYYTLDFVPDGINKISYATSFGISKIPNKYKNKYKKFLSRINYLSVREEKGAEIIKNIANKEADVVCDPTLLFNKEEWMEIQIKERIIKEKYIFCYFLGDNINHRKFVEKLKEKTKLKIVSLNHLDEYVKYSDKFADIAPYDIGPSEFLNLIRNAEYICTDSFHGTVFSLINNKKFYTFRRFSNESKMSTNSRINNLLNMVDLNSRLLYGEENIEDVLNRKINYDDVNKILEKFRNDSKNFLYKSLNIL